MRGRGWVLAKMNVPRGGGGRGCFKTNKGQQGGRGGSKLGNLERTYFLNVTISIKHGYFKLISLHITSLYALQKSVWILKIIPEYQSQINFRKIHQILWNLNGLLKNYKAKYTSRTFRPSQLIRVKYIWRFSWHKVLKSSWKEINH